MHKLSASAAAQSAATDAGAESGPSGRGLVAVRAARVPRTVIAAPLRNQVDHMTAALDSLLAQTERDFALVLVDDLSNEDTARMAHSYCDRDPRVHYQRNETRLGLVGNWRRCFELARELHPDAEYFAWASDHDLWQPRWLEAMVKALDGRPEVVLAYPTTERISADGQVSHTRGGCETLDVADAGTRLQRAHSDMHAGDMVYGLIRAGCLERAGVFRHVLEPDRLVLAELAVQGQFAHVPERLWQRRFLKTASRARQRRAIFPGRRPAHSWLPPSLVRPIVFLWVYVVRGAGRPDVSRRRGLALACRRTPFSAWSTSRGAAWPSWARSCAGPASRWLESANGPGGASGAPGERLCALSSRLRGGPTRPRPAAASCGRVSASASASWPRPPLASERPRASAGSLSRCT